MKIINTVIIIIISAALSACGPIKTTPQETYALSNLKQAKTPARSRTNLSILVSNPSASPGYRTDSMIYMMTPYELKSYADNRWVASPAQMLMPIFVGALRKTGYFSAVASPPFAGITNYHLDTQVLKLQQEFLLPTSRIRLAVQASLVNNVTNRVVASRLFETVVVASANNPYSGVLAANKAAGIISQRIAQFTVRNAH